MLRHNAAELVVKCTAVVIDIFCGHSLNYRDQKVENDSMVGVFIYVVSIRCPAYFSETWLVRQVPHFVCVVSGRCGQPNEHIQRSRNNQSLRRADW